MLQASFLDALSITQLPCTGGFQDFKTDYCGWPYTSRIDENVQRV